MKTAKELPYFDGDFWPNALEDSIKELDQEEEERKTAAAAAAAAETASKEVWISHLILVEFIRTNRAHAFPTKRLISFRHGTKYSLRNQLCFNIPPQRRRWSRSPFNI